MAQVNYVPHPTQPVVPTGTLNINSISQQLETLQRQLAAQAASSGVTEHAGQYVNTRARGATEESGF